MSDLITWSGKTTHENDLAFALRDSAKHLMLPVGDFRFTHEHYGKALSAVNDIEYMQLEYLRKQFSLLKE